MKKDFRPSWFNSDIKKNKSEVASFYNSHAYIYFKGITGTIAFVVGLIGLSYQLEWFKIVIFSDIKYKDQEISELRDFKAKSVSDFGKLSQEVLELKSSKDNCLGRNEEIKKKLLTLDDQLGVVRSINKTLEGRANTESQKNQELLNSFPSLRKHGAWENGRPSPQIILAARNIEYKHSIFGLEKSIASEALPNNIRAELAQAVVTLDISIKECNELEEKYEEHNTSNAGDPAFEFSLRDKADKCKYKIEDQVFLLSTRLSELE